MPALLAVAAVQTWFTVGTVLGVGENPPPIAPGASYRAAWSDFGDAAGAPAHGIVFLPYYEGIRHLGGPEVFQRLWLSGLTAAAAVAVVYFARGLGLGRAAAGIAGFFGVFNPYFLTGVLYLVPRVTLIASGLLGGIVLRVASRGSTVRRSLAFSLLSLLAGFIFVNPPGDYLLAIALAIACAAGVARVGRRAIGRLARFAAIVAVPVALVNLWWIVPSWTSLRGSDARPLSAIGPVALAWVDRRASLGNALGLSTFWAWPQYFSYASKLDAFPFSVLHYSLPLLALLGLVLVRGKRLRRVFTTLLVAVVLLLIVVKGLHSPAVGLNLWLYAHVPGFWLLREPEKTLVLVVILFAVFAGYGAAKLLRTPFAGAEPWIALVLITGSIAYVYPLYTGAVTGAKSGGAVHTRVRVPAYYTQMKQLLDSSGVPGKVLVLPRPTFYQQLFSWGYYGVPIWRYVFDRPIVATEGNGYQAGVAGAGQLAVAVQRSLIVDGGKGIGRELSALGASYVLLAGDLEVKGAGAVSPALLRKKLDRAPDVRLVGRAGPLALYRADRPSGDAYAARPVTYHGPAWFVPEVLAEGNLPSRSALVSAKVRVATKDLVLHGPTGMASLRFRRRGQKVAFVLRGGADGPTRSLMITAPPKAIVTADGAVLKGAMKTVRSSGTSRVIVSQPTGGRLTLQGRRRSGCDRFRSQGSLGSFSEGERICVALSGHIPSRANILRVAAVSRRTRSVTVCFGPKRLTCRTLSTRSSRTRPGLDALVRVPRLRRTILLVVPRSLSARTTVTPYRITGSWVLRTPALISGSLPRSSITQQASTPGICPSLAGAMGATQVPIFEKQGAIELTGGCTALAAIPASDSAFYRVALTSRSRSTTPTPPRLCAWEEGPNHCAVLASPARSRTWHRYEAVFRPDRGTTRLQLYVSSQRGETVEVRTLSLTQLRSSASLAVPVRLAPPVVTVRRHSSESVVLHVSNARSLYLLVLPQTWAHGWHLLGHWAGARPRHVRVDGWENGWLISRRGSYDLELRYTPARYADVAKELDLVLVPLLALTWLGLATHDAVRRRRPG